MRLRAQLLRFSLATAVGLSLTVGVAAAAVTINEIRTDQPSGDLDEYIELKGNPSESLNNVYLVVIGDNSGAGLGGGIDAIVDFTGSSINGTGLFLAAEATFGSAFLTSFAAPDLITNLNFENSDNVSYFLVTGLNDSISTTSDLDQNDDGIIDASGDWGGDGGDDGPPWTSVLDQIALVLSTSSGDLLYGAVQIGPDGTFVPGHVYKCPDTPNWEIAPFSDGNIDTPGQANPSCLNPAPEFVNENRDPCAPLTGATTTVTSTVRSATSARLTYTVNGGAPNDIAMTATPAGGDTTVFSATIPAQGVNGTLVEYMVTAFNANPDTTVNFSQGYFVGTMNIGDLRVNDANGSNIYTFYGARVNGNVTVPYGLFQVTNTDYYVQDATGGINVFQFGVHSDQPALGDDITVAGTIEQFNGKLEITNGGSCDTLIVDLNGPGAVPTPKLIGACGLNEAVEGQLVEWRQVYFDTTGTNGVLGSNVNYDVLACDSLGVMRVDGDTAVPGTAVTSNLITVVGIAGQFDSTNPRDSGYQIYPRFVSDITFITGTTGIGDGAERPMARLLQNFPNPFSRSTDIRFTVPAAGNSDARTPVRLQVFDVQGRLVADLLNEPMDAGDQSVTLNADRLGNTASGVFFYRLEIGDQTITKKLVLNR